jgi:hypothetical protein
MDPWVLACLFDERYNLHSAHLSWSFSDFFGFDFFSVRTKKRFQIYPGTPV